MPGRLTSSFIKGINLLWIVAGQSVFGGIRPKVGGVILIKIWPRAYLESVHNRQKKMKWKQNKWSVQRFKWGMDKEKLSHLAWRDNGATDFKILVMHYSIVSAVSSNFAKRILPFNFRCLPPCFCLRRYINVCCIIKLHAYL